MFQELVKFGREHFNIIVYLITVIISIWNYKKFFDTVLKYFPIIIAYTFFNELLGYFIKYSDRYALFKDATFSNDLIYNIYDFFYYGFFFWVYFRLVNRKSFKKIIKVLALFVMLIYIISSIFQNPLTMSLFYGTVMASLVLVAMVILYFFDSDLKNKVYRNGKNLMLWVSIGLLLFHIIFPFLFLTAYLNPVIWHQYHFQFIIRVLIVVMYSCFCVGFIISKRPAFR